jgi:hypothetical protein
VVTAGVVTKAFCSELAVGEMSTTLGKTAMSNTPATAARPEKSGVAHKAYADPQTVLLIYQTCCIQRS